MNEYTPTTERVRRDYVVENLGSTTEPHTATDGEAEFDRWLAQHDAEVVKATEERIIALLEAKFDVTMKIATLLGHEEPEPTISLETAIALIKGDNK